ncbi:hypothetical protein H4R26_002140 [Coemansia thaxteri]|uniref:NAD(P)-binding protein n=1 Tax=Coemansia thaxteri TaxID=2663907 RepID=A0A9W8BL20_9FUNG|nr:hypothetical protein H4R26_002140 [Coemansia thaxteri]
MASRSFLQNHFLYLLCSLFGVVASHTLAVVDAVSNWWHAAVCALLSLLPKARVKYPVNKPDTNFHPAVLVTGTSSGIGHDTAVALASSGYTVFAGVRSWEDGARVESDFLRTSGSEPVYGSARMRKAQAAPYARRSAWPPRESAALVDSSPATDTDTDSTDQSSVSTKHQIDEAVSGPRHMLQRRLRRMQRRHIGNSGQHLTNGAHPAGAAGAPKPHSSNEDVSCASSSAGCIVPVILDVTNSDSVDQAYARVSEELERREIPLVGVVNNAGVTAFGPMDISAPAFIDHCMNVNFHGPVRVTQKFMPLLRASSGRIVNISSIMTWLIGPGFGVYCASKAALTAASRAWHYELANNNISVSVVEPGITRTPLWNKVESQLELHHARLNGVRLVKKPRGRRAAPAAMPGDEAVASVSPERQLDGATPEAAQSSGLAVDDAAAASVENQALYNPMIRRIKTSNELAPIFALPTYHAVGAIMHALTSQYPKSTYRVGWDARLLGLATWIASEEVVEWLCRIIGIVSEN